MQLLAALFGTLAAVSWFTAAAGWVLALGHRQPDQSLLSHLTQGTKAFDPANFTPQGQRYQRVFFAGMGGFVLFVAATVAVSVLAASP